LKDKNKQPKNLKKQTVMKLLQLINLDYKTNKEN